jgi:hypothetical protein
MQALQPMQQDTSKDPRNLKTKARPRPQRLFDKKGDPRTRKTGRRYLYDVSFKLLMCHDRPERIRSEIAIIDTCHEKIDSELYDARMSNARSNRST